MYVFILYSVQHVGEGYAGAYFVLVTAGQSTDSSPLGRSSACGTCCVTAAGSMDLSVYLSYRTDFTVYLKYIREKLWSPIPYLSL